MKRLLVYGATGYTGDLIVRLARETGRDVVLAGRSEHKVRPLAEELGFEPRVFGLDEAADHLGDCAAVLHCAGPFSRTAAPMVDACLATGTHYLDITGEIAVFEALAARGDEAREAGVMLLPGVGLDVVPTDCLALYVARKLPGATELDLALLSTGRSSHGTATTVLEGLGLGTAVRTDGRIRTLPMGQLNRPFDFGRGERGTTSIGWGDVSTAFHTTGIENIVVYLALPRAGLLASRAMPVLGPVLRNRTVKGWLQGRIDAGPAGPDAAQRAAASVHVCAQVRDSNGGWAAARLHLPDGYSFTAAAGLHIADKALSGDVKPGFATPAGAYGPDLVLEIDGVSREDV